MKFFIATENGSGLEYFNKEDFLAELGRMIDDCRANGGTQFDVEVYPDAECFYHPEDDDDGVSDRVSFDEVLPIVQDWFDFMSEEDLESTAQDFTVGLNKGKDCWEILKEVCDDCGLDTDEFEGICPELEELVDG